MTALSPSANVVSQNSLDSLLKDEKGILELLVRARGSTLKNKDKTRLRDLVLEYSAETDNEEREKLSQQITAILTEHEADLTSRGGNSRKDGTFGEQKDATTAFYGARPEPSFGAQTPVVAQNESRKLSVNTSSAERREVKKEEVPAPTKKVAKSKASPHQPASADASDRSSLASLASGATVPEGTIAPHVENPQARIDEIKRLVNGKFGNPINLISSDPVIGRQYMNALLNAMKKTSGSGLAGELDVAMAALERAFADVQKLISANPETLKTPPQTQVQKVAPPIASEASPRGEMRVPESAPKPEPKKPEIKTSPIAQSNESKPVKKLIRLEDLRPVQKPQKKEEEGLYHKPEDETLAESKLGQAPSDKSLLGKLASGLWQGRTVEKEGGEIGKETLSNKTAPTPSTLREGGPKPSTSEIKMPESAKLQPVATEATLPEKMDTLKKTLADKEASGAKPISGLDSPEVSEGLSRLLSEWKLFKASGFLGTGPSGEEHPLYKQLSNLPMATVIAGRFEGATPEIKQGITDYMNGWRYEQGILHDMGETFEHYLRRVIFQILERGRQQKLTESIGKR